MEWQQQILIWILGTWKDEQIQYHPIDEDDDDQSSEVAITADPWTHREHYNSASTDPITFIGSQWKWLRDPRGRLTRIQEATLKDYILKQHRSTRRRADLEQIRQLQAGLTLQTLHAVLDRDASMIKPALEIPKPRQPSQQNETLVETATEMRQPTADQPPSLHPTTRHTEDDADTESEDNPMIQ